MTVGEGAEKVQQNDGAGGARRRARTVALVLVLLTPLGFLLALAFQWPSDFVLDEASVDGRVTVADIVSGTVTSMPLPPWVVLVLATVATTSRRRAVSAGGLVVLALLGVVFTIGGLGEVTSDNPEVPGAVLVVAGLAYTAIGLSLCVTALAALRASLRR